MSVHRPERILERLLSGQSPAAARFRAPGDPRSGSISPPGSPIRTGRLPRRTAPRRPTGSVDTATRLTRYRVVALPPSAANVLSLPPLHRHRNTQTATHRSNPAGVHPQPGTRDEASAFKERGSVLRPGGAAIPTDRSGRTGGTVRSGGWKRDCKAVAS